VLTYERWQQEEKERLEQRKKELGLNDPNRPKSLHDMNQEKLKQQFDLEMKNWKKHKQGPMPVWNSSSLDQFSTEEQQQWQFEFEYGGNVP